MLDCLRVRNEVLDDSKKYLPHLSSRVLCGLREGIQGLQPHPIALENEIIGQARLEENTHPADPSHTWSSLNELHQSYVPHPIRDHLQRARRNTDERDYVWMVQPLPHNCFFEE